MLVLDSGAVTALAQGSRQALAYVESLRREGKWPAVVPSVVLVECLRGHAHRDAPANRILKTCDIVQTLPDRLARRAAYLRAQARRGSAVDAIVVATAEPGGTVLTTDLGDLEALAARADGVLVERI